MAYHENFQEAVCFRFELKLNEGSNEILMRSQIFARQTEIYGESFSDVASPETWTSHSTRLVNNSSETQITPKQGMKTIAVSLVGTSFQNSHALQRGTN